MLVDPKLPIPVGVHMAHIIDVLNDGNWGLERITTGIWSAPVQVCNLLEAIIEAEYPFTPLTAPEGWDKDAWLTEMIRRIKDPKIPSDYGVVDTPEQVLKRFPIIENDPRPLMVGVTEIRREDEPAQGGWRWHKWGPYYGHKRPKCEYLVDEPNISAVWVYHLLQLKEGTYTAPT